MNNTVIYTSECVYIKIKLKKTPKIKDNTLQEYEQKFGANYCSSVKMKCVAEILDRIKKRNKKYDN